jgi:hypothetical protein
VSFTPRKLDQLKSEFSSVSVDALQSDAVKIGVQSVIALWPVELLSFYEKKTLKLPGF